MPKTAKTYPDWVQQYRERGTTVKKKGDAYYLYKRTSRRVPGKKYPQPVDTYIGVITPDGVVRSGRKCVSLTSIEVREYGFSKAVWDLCTQGWKDPLGDNWEDVLSTIIVKRSPNSYLAKERTIRPEEDFRYQFPAQTSSLSRRIFKEHGVGLEELEILKTVFLVYLENETVVSNISVEQGDLLERLGISLEVH